MLKTLDSLLDRLTMYRLLLYYLIALLLAAMGLSIFGVLHYNAFAIAGAAIYLDVVCWITNKTFAWILEVPTNSDSTHITALILALIITPNFNQDGLLFLTAAAGLAMASKYILSLGNKHIFNPAAIAVTLLAIGPQQSASWWVGSSAMAPFVLIGGVLLMRRIRRNEMVLTFLASALAATALYAAMTHGDVVGALHRAVFSSALLFMGFVMLTEPLTSPATRKWQIVYGALAGLLFPPRIHIGSVFSTPERVLIIGNIFAYIVNPRIKVFPQLSQRLKITPDSMDFVFATGQRFNYEPGQYMEWTLPHSHTDSRGQRRYFTLASSPTEPDLRIGIKFYPKGSSFKKAMLNLNKHSAIVAASLGGDFVLPHDRTKPVVLIAGGIGVTPYRSMIKYLLDTSERRPLTLIYSANTARDIAYASIFDEAQRRLGIKVVYTLTLPDTTLPDSRFRAGYITPELLRSTVPGYEKSLFYISGPHAMVVDIETMLKDMNVSSRHIKTDFFSGYA